MKRVFLFLVTNLAVVFVLGIVANLLGVDRWLTANGLNYGGLLVFAALFGFGGAFISLAMSKWMAKRSTGAHVITEPRDATERWLVDTVRRQAQQAGIGMPEVAIYDAPDVNAFATGMSRNNALVAVSTATPTGPFGVVLSSNTVTRVGGGRRFGRVGGQFTADCRLNHLAGPVAIVVPLTSGTSIFNCTPAANEQPAADHSRYRWQFDVVQRDPAIHVGVERRFRARGGQRTG